MSATYSASMTAADYRQLIAALRAATGLIAVQNHEPGTADLRICSLVALAEKEAKRALLEASREERAFAGKQDSREP